jgi:hypothetical protein
MGLASAVGRLAINQEGAIRAHDAWLVGDLLIVPWNGAAEPPLGESILRPPRNGAGADIVAVVMSGHASIIGGGQSIKIPIRASVRICLVAGFGARRDPDGLAGLEIACHALECHDRVGRLGTSKF